MYRGENAAAGLEPGICTQMVSTDHLDRWERERWEEEWNQLSFNRTFPRGKPTGQYLHKCFSLERERERENERERVHILESAAENKIVMRKVYCVKARPLCWVNGPRAYVLAWGRNIILTIFQRGGRWERSVPNTCQQYKWVSFVNVSVDGDSFFVWSDGNIFLNLLAKQNMVAFKIFPMSRISFLRLKK